MLSELATRRVELTVPRRGEKLELLRLAEGNAREDCQRATTREERVRKLLLLLQETLELSTSPRRIEAFDISNTGSADIVAAMTVFIDGTPKRGAFRYFKIKGLDSPNDYASMDQALTRRFLRSAEGDKDFAQALPELLLIDGGAEHAKVARNVLEGLGLAIPVFGMVKDHRHRTRGLMTPEGQEIGLLHQPALFAFVGQIQEETHNAAVSFHQKQRSKTGTGSALEKIPGIGEARRKQLLKTFKSVKGIRTASLSRLEEVLPKPAAKAVYDYFRTQEE
jgi:excinuclease ABC subunit C